MGKPLALETRRAIVRMVKTTDSSQADVARIFKVTERSVRRYMRLHRETGDVDSHAKFGGHKQPILAKHAKLVATILKKEASTTLDELKALLEQEGIVIGRSALNNNLRALGYSNKKNGVWSRTEAERCSGSPRGIQKPSKRA